CRFASSRLRRPLISPLFPYTTLFRSRDEAHIDGLLDAGLCHPPCLSHHRDEVGERRAQDGVQHLPLRRRHLRIEEPVCGGLVLRSEEHTSELQSRVDLVCRLLLEKKK